MIKQYYNNARNYTTRKSSFKNINKVINLHIQLQCYEIIRNEIAAWVPQQGVDGIFNYISLTFGEFQYKLPSVLMCNLRN